MRNAWLGCCAAEARGDVRLAAISLGAGSDFEFADGPDALRRLVASEPGAYGVVVGAAVSGVSDVNLAAAVARDGCARSVVLVRRGASGSLRSRASSAGVDLVIDPAEIGKLAPAPVPPSVGAKAPVAAPAQVQDADGLDEPSSVLEAAPEPVAMPPQRRRPVVPTPPAVSGRAPVIAFCSGRGGVGKTALAAAAAVAAAQWGMQVLLLDLDLSCGNLYSLFGLSGGFDFSGDAAEGGGALPKGAQACPGVRLLGPCELPEHSELAASAVGGLIRTATGVADLVLVDTSATFTEAVAQAVQQADRVLIVADARRGCASSLARTSGLAVRLGVARTRIARLENRADKRSRSDPMIGRAEVGLEGARTFRVVDGGEEVEELLGAGRAAELFELGVPFADSAATMLAQVLTELGQLPDCEAARRALEAGQPKRRQLFGKRREERIA